jgi:hypothetical protein
VLGRYSSTRIEALRNPGEKPGPDLGRHALMLSVAARPPKGWVRPPVPDPNDVAAVLRSRPPMPGALERTFLAADSPAVAFPTGTWVRISFWAKVAGVAASADGALVYDSAGGEPLAARIYSTTQVVSGNPVLVWKEYHLYRQVPASGRIGVTFALTGLGDVYIDDVRIEPMEPVAAGKYRPDAPANPPPKRPPGSLTSRPRADGRP